jgi:hypothetical protein
MGSLLLRYKHCITNNSKAKHMKKLSSVLLMFLMSFLLITISCNRQSKPTSFIQPPIQGVDIPFQEFVINPENPDTLKFKMGTTIVIPSNSFVDSAGNIVKDEVTLKYREFRNAAEIFMAGISMNYNAMGNETALETAGMFELRAFSKKRKLKLRKSKFITVKMGSKVEGANYNFFGLDEETGNWNFMGYPETEANPEYQKIVENIEKLEKTQKYPLGDEFFVFDYNAAFDVTYYHLGKKFKDNTMKARIKQYGGELYNLYTWDYVKYRGQSYYAQFMLWKNLSGKLPHWVRKKNATARVKKLRGNVHLITVTYKERKYSFKAEIEMPLKVLYAYSPKYLKENYEEAMKKLEEENMRLELEAKVYRSFQVNRLGILNYDALYKAKDPVYAHVDFELDFVDDQQMYEGGKVFLIPEGRRSVLTLRSFTNQYLALDKSDKQIKMFTLLPGGEVGIIDSTQIKVLDFNKFATEEKPKITLKFRKWEKQLKSEEDVNMLFGI